MSPVLLRPRWRLQQLREEQIVGGHVYPGSAVADSLEPLRALGITAKWCTAGTTYTALNDGYRVSGFVSSGLCPVRRPRHVGDWVALAM